MNEDRFLGGIVVASLFMLATMTLPGAPDRVIGLDHLAVPEDAELLPSFAQVPTQSKSGRAASATVTRVSPGRYAVNVQLAAPPFGRSGAQVDCIVDVAGLPPSRRSLKGPDFPSDGSPSVVTLNAVITNVAAVRLSIEWTGNQPTTSAPPAEPGWELNSLRIHPVALTRLDKGLGLVRVFPNKLLYGPKETGRVAVTVRNFTDAAQEATLELRLVQELDRARPLPPVAVALAAGAEKTFEVPFTCDNRRYGCEARATLVRDKTVLDTNRDYFSVHDNVWAVALGAGGIGIMGMSGYANADSIARDARTMREVYANWWEKMFWPPDDWGDMTPDRNEWISGQSARWENAANIKAFIAAVKPQGIKSITYGKHCAGGPEGWELVRRHPDWFYQDGVGHPSGQFNTWDLAFWHDIKRHVDPIGRKQFSSDSWGAMPDFRQPQVLEWGIKELLESSKTFGWDGVRFDGHWTAVNDALSTANMRRLKEALWAYDPGYRFGFNESWSFGYQSSHTVNGMVTGFDHELRESMAGGGLYMQEAIGQWGYAAGSNQRYTSWRTYATQEVAAANGVRNLGGTYHFIYGTWSLDPAHSLYKFALGTAAGIHPVYGDQIRVPGCANWGRFLTRWSAFVWDLNLQPLNADGVVEVNAARPLWWREWVKERVADAKTQHLIVHLINPPSEDAIEKRGDLLPLPATNVTVRVKRPRGAKLVQAALLDPAAGDEARALSTTASRGWAEVTVPRVSLWSMVVFEFSGRFKLPPDKPRFTEPSDSAKVAEARQTAARPGPVDPLRPNEQAGGPKDEWLYETDTGYNSCPARGIADADAMNGLAQVRDAGETSAYVGRSWLGPLAPGKYVARIRVKLEDPARPARRQSLHWTLYRYPANECVRENVSFATADAKLPENRTLIVDNQYHYYEIPFEISVGMPVSLIAGVGTPDPGDHRLLVDHIVIKQLEAYTDAKLATMTPLNAPAGLTVGGAPGLDVLVVKGWTWDTYGLDGILSALTATNRIAELWSNTGDAIGFPTKHADLFPHDVVVLADVGAFAMQYEGRKVLRDFVEAGGGLLLLGGSYTLGQGSYPNTFLEDLLPVQIAGGRDVEQAASPLPLKPVGSGAILNGLKWQQDPVVFWRHRVTAKSGAVVYVTAGGEPLLVMGTYGKGRVAVFAGTALGEPKSGEVPFWQWDGWPQVMRNTIAWLTKE